MKITIIKPGLLTTIQDMGRRNFLSDAVPVSGVMDALSARVANKCVGNADTDAVLEFTYADTEFRIGKDTLIAYAGDGGILKCNDIKIPAERPVFIPSGCLVKLAGTSVGCRTYLAIAGGFNVPQVLSSRSTYLIGGFGGLEGRQLKAGDALHNNKMSYTANLIYQKLKSDQINYPRWSVPRSLVLPEERKTIRVIPANEFTWFSADSLIGFLSQSYTLNNRSNRMGYHLDGEPIQKVKNDELLSTAVTPGTIQVTNNGSMILLMYDCQTTGGYPRIAQVAAVDMPLCGQLKPGDSIYFKEIGIHDAEMLYIEQQQTLHKLSLAVKSKLDTLF